MNLKRPQNLKPLFRMRARAETSSRLPGVTLMTVVSLVFSFSVMTYFVRTILSIAGPSIMKEFNLSETEMGTVYSAFLLSYALFMLPGGCLTDLWGPKIALTFVAVGSGVLTSLTGFAARPGLGALLGVVPSLLLVRFLLGVCTAPIYPACARINADWIPAKYRGQVQGLIVSGAGLGGAVSPVVFSSMMSRYGWRYSFLFAGMASVALGMIWCIYMRNRLRHPTDNNQSFRLMKAENKPAQWSLLLRNRNIVLLALGFMALDYFEYIFFYWTYYYLSEIRHVEVVQSALYTTLPFTAWTLMTPVGGWASDRMVAWLGSVGLRIMVIGGLSLSAILLLAGAHVQSVLVTVAMMSLALGLAASADVCFWTATINIAGRQSGTACGILNTGGNIGGLVAPVLTPWIAGKAGWSYGLGFGSLMALAGAVLWLFIDPSRRVGLESGSEETAQCRAGVGQ